MKVALVTWDASCSTLGGAYTVAPQYVLQGLQHAGVLFSNELHFEIISISTRKWDDAISRQFRSVWWQDVDLGQYDYVFFIQTASLFGSSLVEEEVLSTIRSPFGILIHDEYELKLQFKSSLPQFFEHPNLDFIQYIFPEMQNNWEDHYDIPTVVKKFIAPCYPPNITDTDFSTEKERKITYAGRMVKRKQVDKLLHMIPYLPINIKVELFGARYPSPYDAGLDIYAAMKTHYKGTYDIMSFNPIKNAMFSWNVVWREQFAKRIELTTIESLQHGTLPILARETTPDWFPQKYPLLFDWIHFSNLSSKEQADILAKKMNHPTMPTVNLELCHNLLWIIAGETGYMDVYAEIYQRILNS